MAGIPETNRAWLQGSSPGAAKGYTPVLTSPLLPEQMSWQVNRVKISLEQRMSTPTNIPSGPGADGTGIAFQETIVMDSSFSEDSIDEIREMVSGVEENISKQRSTLSAENVSASSPVRNAEHPANNRGGKNHAVDSINTHSDQPVRSEKKQVDSDRYDEQLYTKFYDHQLGPQKDRNTLKLQGETEKLHCKPLLNLDQDDDSVGSFSGTSTPVRTWHYSHESPEEAERSNQLQPHQSEDSRISKARTAIESGFALRSTPTSIPSVLCVPELSRCKQSSLTNHLNRRCTPNIPGARPKIPEARTLSSSDALLRAQLNFVKQKEELVQVREHFSRTLEHHRFPKSVSDPLHVPHSISTEKSPDHSCDRALGNHCSSACNSVSSGVSISASYQDQDRPRNSVLSNVIDLQKSDEQLVSVPIIPTDAVPHVVLAAPDEGIDSAMQERRQSGFLLMAEIQRNHHYVEGAMEILNEIRQAQADVAWLETNLSEQKRQQGSYARSQATELQAEAADFADTPQPVQISECDDAGHESNALGRHGSSNSEQLLQEKLDAATFELESLKHSMDIASREAIQEKERILIECDQIKLLLNHALQSRSTLEEQLELVHHQHSVELQDLKAGHTVDVAKLQQIITEISERCNTGAAVLAELKEKLANVQKCHARFVADLERKIRLMSHDHTAAMTYLNQCMEHLQDCSERDESTYRKNLGAIKLLHNEQITQLERKILERENSLLQLNFTCKSADLQFTETLLNFNCQLQDLRNRQGSLHLCHMEACELARGIQLEISSLSKLMALKHEYSVCKVRRKISRSAKSVCLRLWIRKFRHLRKVQLIYSKVQAKANTRASIHFLKLWKVLTRQRAKIYSFTKKNDWKRGATLTRFSWQKWISEASENKRLKNSCATIVQRMRDRQLAHSLPMESDDHAHITPGPFSTHSHGSLHAMSADAQVLSTQRDPYRDEQLLPGYKTRYPHIEERSPLPIFSGSDLQSIMSKYSDFSPPGGAGAMRNLSPNSDFMHVQGLNARELKTAEVGKYLQTSPYADGPAQSSMATLTIQGCADETSKPRLGKNYSVLSERAKLSYIPTTPIEHFQGLRSKFELENIQLQTKAGSEVYSKGLPYQYRADVRPAFHSTDPVRKSPFSSLSARGRAILRKHGISSGQMYDLSPEVWALSHQTMQPRNSSPVFGFNQASLSRLSTPS